MKILALTAASSIAAAFLLPTTALADHSRKVSGRCGQCNQPIYSYRVAAGYDSCRRPIYRWVLQPHNHSNYHNYRSRSYPSRSYPSRSYPSRSYPSRGYYSRGGSCRQPSYRYGYSPYSRYGISGGRGGISFHYSFGR